MSSIPVTDPSRRPARARSRSRGELPSPIAPPSGCRFRTRCPRAADVCATEEPVLRAMGGGQFVACHFPIEHTSVNGTRSAHRRRRRLVTGGVVDRRSAVAEATAMAFAEDAAGAPTARQDGDHARRRRGDG